MYYETIRCDRWWNFPAYQLQCVRRMDSSLYLVLDTATTVILLMYASGKLYCFCAGR
jgi:hypothetical protein